MPDVSRSDSQRSDSSQRPRVSFNRDVHVKRIGHPGTPRVVGALVGDGEGHLIPLTVRRERPTRLSRRELAKEARRVLDQVDSVHCTSRSSLDFQNTKGNNKRRFNTLPPIRNKKSSAGVNSGNNSPSSSLDRSGKQRNLVTSIFSSLDRAKVKKSKNKENDQETKSKLSKKSSSSLSDLARTSSSSPERLTDFKRRKTELTRSVSDADKYKKSNKSLEKSSNFLSLDRLLVKKNKNKANNYGEFSDKSPSPPPRHRKGFQRKSYSDSETPDISEITEHARVELGINKKQLSPIIEVSPREDYFGSKDTKKQGDKDNLVLDTKPENLSQVTMHSSQITYRPPLTRGKTVNLMVKRLSQDPLLNRGPPRTLNASSGLVTPGEDRQHNNNLPFSYTEPTLRAVTPTSNERDNSTPTYTALNSKAKLPTISDSDCMSPTTGEGQVIYAEVVVSGGGNGMPSKQTIHTQVPPVKQFSSDKTKRNQVQESDAEEDEGLCLSMDTSNRYENRYDYTKSEIHNYGKWGSKHENDSFTKGISKAKNNSKKYINLNGNDINKKNTPLKYQISIEQGQKANNSRKEYAFQESKYETNDYIFDSSRRGRADGMDCLKNNHVLEGYDAFEDDLVIPNIKKNVRNDFSKDKSYKTEYHSDDINGNQNYRKYDIKNDTAMHSRINSSDLSSRRDRLESRIESQRRERFLNSKLYHDKDFSLPNRKHQNDSPNNSKSAYHNRRDFLNSQIDFDKNSGKSNSIKHENARNYAKNNRYIESFPSEIEGHNKTEIFADSGIETDYRKDSTCHNSYNKYDRELNDERERKGQRSGHQSPVAKIELNGLHKLAMSDEEDNIMNSDNYLSNTENHVAYNKRSANNSFMSTKLIQEQKRTTEALPASAVLVRHYSPDIQNGIRTIVDQSQAEYSNSEDEYKDNRDDERIKTEEYVLSKERDNNKKNAKANVTEIKKFNESSKKNQSLKEDTKKPKKKQVSAMNKMKQLFSRNDNKDIKKDKKDGKKDAKLKEKERDDDEKEDNDEEDPLAARYTEYRGSDIEVDKETLRLKQRQRYTTEFEKYGMEGIKKGDYQQIRQRLATPSPRESPSPPYSQQSSATLTRNVNSSRNVDSSGGNHWFKSLDRLKNGKAKKKVKQIAEETTEDEMQMNSWREKEKPAYQTNKNLRFFGDTDQESVKSARHQPARRYKSNSTTANSSNRLQVPQRGGLKNHHRLHRSAGDVATSSAESTTEGDSSQHSQRSVVYLHAATVGDIPGPNKGGSRRALSREELSSLASSNRLKPQTRTVSRSISVLAPWKPRHYREGLEVRYDNDDHPKAGGKGEGKPPKIPASNHLNGTLSRVTRRKLEENGKNSSSDKHKFKSMSSESLSYGDYPNNTQNSSKEQLSKKKQSPMSASYESLTYNGTPTRDKKTNSKTNSALNVSAIELNSISNNKAGNSKKYVNDNKKSSSKLKRSASVPKDSKSTGWFKLRSKK